MRNYKHIVKEDSPFSGHITMKLMPYMDRIRFIQGLSYGPNKEGVIEKMSDESLKSIKITEEVIKHIEEISLKIKKSGDEIKSIDDLTYYQEGVEILNELASVLLSGVSLGKF